MFVKPKPGVVLRDPITRQVLPPEGRRVQESGFWLRRIAEGSVDRFPEPPAKSEPAPVLPELPKKEKSK